MGFVEKIGRKLSGSRSSDGTSTPNSPNGNGTVISVPIVQQVPPHVRSQSQQQQGYGRSDAVRGNPGTNPAAVVGSRNDSLGTTHNTRTTGNHHQQQQQQPQSQSRSNNGTQRLSPPVQRPAISISPPSSQSVHSPPSSRNGAPNNISPPTSRLAVSPPGAQKAAPNNTNSNLSGNNSQHNRNASMNTDSKPQQHNLQKQPSMASSLHSSRSGQTGNHVGGLNQQGISTNQRGRAGARPANQQRNVARSTARMEDSAYHAGFRDAVAQLEREKRGRGPAMSNQRPQNTKMQVIS